ncbi:2-oxoacid:acceptor oxidoreductase subunit alpha [Geothrix edaphica]|uniref:Pyruvate ferredoxin oxidoreductase n=1 Tax=Geothrix edaphica TaxID=2927976 RepID=A0ABQ5PVJ8_9BACT|nr:2-oxoacid:acceptor oxidoreductase subunit alpha [Geothrix edaphica]GLH66125.1 pyruvate ferredoxin oxidoreductase [Geothrix edaphica]
MRKDLVFGMAGSGGDGIVSAGDSLLQAASAEGYHGVMTKSFGSQIRGGESSCRVRISTDPVLNPGGNLDVAVALNWEDFLKFGAELPVAGTTVVIYEAATGVAENQIPLVGVTPLQVIAVPIAAMAKETAGTERAKNTVVLGLIAGWFGIGGEAVMKGISKKLAKKSQELVEANQKAFDSGVAFAKSHPLKADMTIVPSASKGAVKLLTDGNDMCAAAAIFAGCQFFGGYPITPSTEIMQFFTNHVWKYGGAVLQAEDEIAGIGAAVGASFAGKKAMTATSGPGLSLKSEMMGLASIAELPLVIVDVQRGGPSTGLPTKTEQSDLFAAAFSAHGDVIRPVLAPTSVADIFRTTVEAFNIAEYYQTPVIILSDQEIASRKETLDPIDTSQFKIIDRLKPTGSDLQDYKRFKQTENHISPISHPGMLGGTYLASGIEHVESGAPTNSGSVHARMNDKRIKKLDPLKDRKDLFEITGNPDAPLALVAWGSVAGVCREALQMAREQGLDVKLMVPYLLYPVAEQTYRDFFVSVQKGLVVEQSHLAQTFKVLRMHLDLPKGLQSLARSGANPFLPGEIVAALHQLLAELQRSHEGKLQPQE